ncbi:DUF6397 family protein [Streptomyces sp. TLI_105]|uniref:DUF6397 family protein n=1 Tax=Streptomyces sp. TLI_105 TaxID=1881019 RepID=UPI0008953D1B|nr:DUF6397 family protein [Streptomyces sp. TLI_105]SEE11768.1 hypothetical protein SAMN05428939_7405 [Streptomyces sp. TLI_105]
MTVDEGARTVAPGRAAQELELRRDEFRLAVQLGLVRTVPAGEGERRRVERRELDRLRAAPDFPAGLRERVRAVGTGEAAALLGITADRFTRLARTGHISPVRFSLNRYRMVVWLYLAQEVVEFGLTCPALLTGRLPLYLRERLAAHEDLRARNWRARRLSLLLRATEDPWARAAAIASLLDPVQVAEVVDDPYERTHLDRLRPPPPPGMPVPPVAREIAERLTLADDPDEILWHRLSLALALDEARAERQAPHPGETRAVGVGASASTVPLAGPVRAEAVAMVPVAGEVVPEVPVHGVPATAASGPAAPVSMPAVPAVPVPTAPVPAAPVPTVLLPAVPVPAASVPAGRAVAIDPSAGRPVRTRFLERFRRGRAAGAARSRRRRRPVAWP